ncbi:NAD(P)/FAD-dependent oxidoreductase [uncultured Alsobacter sp.]|uniref:flavin-containing monooxygenase n=1 Tax=uncultured Alsobacter sp. TaxID=1748258 RepID=UPI0025F9E6AE|nr:NAD(P)/FAD-dependent oxidoreductase [uncultured Alsobacter sp.]
MNDKAGTTGAVKRLDAVIVGAGFGGMYAVYKFREMGLSFVGIEAGGDVGGVWYWNRYPGARCDLMSVDYSYSFSREIEQEWTWSERFAGQPEILAYANFVADRLDLRKHIQFNTRVTGAVWDERRQLWVVKTDKGETIEATYCVMATGPISTPKDPDIPGIASYEGELLRAQKWPHHPVSFAGKRVGVIGVGSTGIQVIQEVGKEAGELYVFQRTPSYSMPMRNQALEADYVAEMKKHYPALRAAMRMSPNGGVRPSSTRPFFSLPPSMRRQVLEHAWEEGGHSVLGAFSDVMVNQEANDQVADFLREKIGQIVKDPKTAELLKPRGYPVFARRPCLDSGYYETYNKPNVHLVDCNSEPIEAMTAKGVRTSAREIELDMVIFATGYDGLTGALLAFEVTGRGGLKMSEKWSGGARSFLGLMMEGFPNLFTTAGPNGPAALANLININEHDVDWIAAAITYMADNKLTAMEPTKQAEDDWMELVATLAPRTLLSKASTWYTGTNVKGKPTGLTMFVGGFPKYVEHCANATKDGYHAFSFKTREATAAA